MLNFFGKNRQPAPPTPWLKWLVLAFLAMAVISSMNRGTPQSPGKVHQAVEQAKEEIAPEKLLNLHAYKAILRPAQPRDIEAGSGEATVCGQTAHIAYKSYAADNSLLSDETLTVRIGEGKAPPVIETGIIGMQPGGKRNLIAAAGTGNAPARFEVELRSAEPALPDIEHSAYRIVVTRETGETPIACGHAGKFSLTMWDVDGKKRYTTPEPIIFTPGKSEIAIGIEQAVVGMGVGSARTIILPPDFQKTLEGNKPLISIPFPKDETVLVDIESVP